MALRHPSVLLWNYKNHQQPRKSFSEHKQCPMKASHYLFIYSINISAISATSKAYLHFPEGLLSLTYKETLLSQTFNQTI